MEKEKNKDLRMCQKCKIHQMDWDVLIVLDACRFDYFQKEYKSYLDGQLTKVYSPASDTFSWLGAVFPYQYDITVYSAHPVLNSMGIKRGSYEAKPHFKRIVNIFDKGWDYRLGTVPPINVNKVVIEEIKNGKWKGRNIIWYIQPHAPWIGETRITGKSKGCDDKQNLHQIWEEIKNGTIPKKELKKAYRDNLRKVLKNVSNLIPYLNGKIIITSDHGEHLGEKGHFGHSSFTMLRELIKVPWLEVKKNRVVG